MKTNLAVRRIQMLENIVSFSEDGAVSLMVDVQCVFAWRPDSADVTLATGMSAQIRQQRDSLLTSRLLKVDVCLSSIILSTANR